MEDKQIINQFMNNIKQLPIITKDTVEEYIQQNTCNVNKSLVKLFNIVFGVNYTKPLNIV